MKLTKSQLKQIIKEVLLEGLPQEEAEALVGLTRGYIEARNAMLHKRLDPDTARYYGGMKNDIIAAFMSDNYRYSNISEFILAHCESAKRSGLSADDWIQFKEHFEEKKVWEGLTDEAKACMMDHIGRQEDREARPPGYARWKYIEPKDLRYGRQGYTRKTRTPPSTDSTLPMPKLEQMIKEELAQVLRESPWRP